MTSFQYGLTLAAGGFALLVTQVWAVDLWRAYKAIKQDYATCLNHDTSVFPDDVSIPDDIRWPL